MRKTRSNDLRLLFGSRCRFITDECALVLRSWGPGNCKRSRRSADPLTRFLVPLFPAFTPPRRGTSCTSSRCRRGRDRCGPPFRRSAAAWAGLRRRRPGGWPRPARAASCGGTPSPADRWSSKAAAWESQSRAARHRLHRQAAPRSPPAEPAAPAPRGRGPSAVHGLPIRPQNLHPEQEPDRVLLELQHHRFEHVEGLALVLHQRILLRIAAQTDAFLQVVHREQVVLPQPVDHAQHHHPLVVAHGRRAQNLLLRLVALLSACQRSPRPARAGSAPRIDARSSSRLKPK